MARSAFALFLMALLAVPATAAMADPFPQCIRDCNPIPDPRDFVLVDANASVNDEDGVHVDYAAGVFIGHQGVILFGHAGYDGALSCGGGVYYGFNGGEIYQCA